jgi:hypothetical protein
MPKIIAFVRQLVDLERDRDERDLAADGGDAGAEPEPAEVPRGAQRCDVESQPRQERSPSGALRLPRRIVALRVPVVAQAAC